ncbi:hypothetical protein DBR21_01695, partial [Caulobacter sp. HMWF009]
VIAAPVAAVRRTRLRGLRSLGCRRGLGRSRRWAPAAVPVGAPPTTPVRAIIPVATVGLPAAAWALATAVSATVTSAIATVAARLARGLLTLLLLLLLALRSHCSGRTGLRRCSAQQRQHHGGRNQTLHFLLQKALCQARALSLDSKIVLPG